MTQHTDKEIAQAAERLERLAETLDPATARVEETNDLFGPVPAEVRAQVAAEWPA